MKVLVVDNQLLFMLGIERSVGDRAEVVLASTLEDARERITEGISSVCIGADIAPQNELVEFVNELRAKIKGVHIVAFSETPPEWTDEFLSREATERALLRAFKLKE